MGVMPDNLGNITPMNEIIVHLAGIGGKTREPVIGRSEVEERLMRVVKKDPVREFVVNANVERNGRVKWVGAGTIAEVVCIPVGIPCAFSIEWTGFFSQPDESF